MGGFDHATFAKAFSRPGIDPRQWVSFGTVSKETPEQKSVIFDDELGPLVLVDLQPSQVQVVCRVAGGVAGNGEGEYFPFLQGDEVVVAVPEGSEVGGCTIVGRLNNALDKFPTMVAGNDPTENNFAFRRMRTPYVVETSSSYILRSATSGAFMGITEEGAVTFANADKALLQLGADVLGFRNGDADVLVEISVANKSVSIEAGGTKIHLTTENGMFLASGQVAVAGAGRQPMDHATTAEATLNFLQNFIPALGTALVALGAIPIPTTAALGAALLTPGLGIATLNAMLAGMAVPVPAAPFSGSVLTVLPALQTLLAIPRPIGIAGLGVPGAGSPGVLVG